jgi:hypothetical protein
LTRALDLRDLAGEAITSASQPAEGLEDSSCVTRWLPLTKPLLFPDGWIAIVQVVPYSVEWLDGAGDLHPLPTTAFCPGRVTTAKKRAAIARWFGHDQPCDPSDFTGWPETMPPVLDGGSQPREALLLVVPGGNVAIARAPASASTDTRYDLVNRRAELVGTIVLARGEAIIGFGARAVYVLQTDDDTGLQRIRAPPLALKGSGCGGGPIPRRRSLAK